MAFFVFPHHLPRSQLQVFSWNGLSLPAGFLTDNKFVPACWITLVLLSHSELPHLCVHPSRETDALRVPHPPRLMDPCPKYAPTKSALQAKAATAPASGVCFPAQVQRWLHESTFLLTEIKGDLHRGFIMRKWNNSLEVFQQKLIESKHFTQNVQRSGRFHQTDKLKFLLTSTDLPLPLVCHW